MVFTEHLLYASVGHGSCCSPHPWSRPWESWDSWEVLGRWILGIRVWFPSPCSLASSVQGMGGADRSTLVVAVGGGSDHRPSPVSQELSLRSLRAEPLFSLCRCPAVHLHSDKHLSQVPWAQGDCAGPQAILNGTVVMIILVLLL